MGWISEHRLDSLQLAYVLYDSLVHRYPESVYAKQIQPKLMAVREAEQQKAAEKAESLQQDSSGVALKQPVRINEDALQEEVDAMGESEAESDAERLESRLELSSDRIHEIELSEKSAEEPADTLRSIPDEEKPNEQAMPSPDQEPDSPNMN